MEEGSGVHKLPEKLDYTTENWVTPRSSWIVHTLMIQ
jgi:hypothetical protein